MHRVTLFLATVLVLFLMAVTSAVPTWAGEEGKKCTMDTQACLNKMTEYLKTTGWVGIEYEPQEDHTWKILRVVPSSPAEAAGLQSGDLVFAMNGISFHPENEMALKEASKNRKPGVEISYAIKRGGQDKEIKLTLAPMPADVMAQWIGRHMLEHAQLANVAEAQP